MNWKGNLILCSFIQMFAWNNQLSQRFSSETQLKNICNLRLSRDSYQDVLFEQHCLFHDKECRITKLHAQKPTLWLGDNGVVNCSTVLANSEFFLVGIIVGIIA